MMIIAENLLVENYRWSPWFCKLLDLENHLFYILDGVGR